MNGPDIPNGPPLILIVGDIRASVLEEFVARNSEKFRFTRLDEFQQPLFRLSADTPVVAIVWHAPPERDAAVLLRALSEGRRELSVLAVVVADQPFARDAATRELGVREILPASTASVDDIAWAVGNVIELHALRRRSAIRANDGNADFRCNLSIDIAPGLRRCVEKSPLGAAMFDRNLRLLAASQKWWSVLGVAAPIAIGGRANDISNRVALDWDHIAAEALAGKTSERSELTFEGSDGPRWLRCTAYPWMDRRDVVGGVVMSAEDITEAQRNMAERQAMEESYCNFFEHAAFGAAEILVDGRIQRVNDRICQMGGYERQDLIGRFVTEFLYPDEQAENLVARSTHLNDGESTFVHGARYIGKDGVYRRVQITGKPVRNASGVALYATGIVEDITDQIEADAALRDSEERYRAFFNNGAFGAIEVSIDGVITKPNKSLCRIIGFSDIELIGRRVETFVHQDDLDAFMAARTAYIQGDPGQINRTWRVVHKDGSLIWLGVQLTLIRDKDGAPLYSCGVLEDMTEQKKAEQAIRDSEERYQIFFNNGAFGAIEADPDGRILRVNKWICDTSGYSLEELIGSQILEFMHPDDLAAYLAARSSYIDGQKDAVNGVWRFKRKHDGYFSLRTQATMIRDEQGKPLYSCGIGEDVTEELAAQEALRASEARYRAFFDNGAFGALESDLSGRLIKVNQFMADLGGYEPEDMIGRTMLEFIHPDDRYHCQEVINRLVRGDVDATVEARRFRRKDGEYSWIRFRPMLLRDANGAPAYLCAIAEDISEELKAEIALRESEERLRKLSDNIPNTAVYTLTRGPTGSPHVSYISAGVQALTGVKPEEVITNIAGLFEMIFPAHRQDYIGAALKCAEQMSDLLIELPITRRDGQLRWIRLHSRPTRLQDGRVVWDGVVTDITERKLAEIALERNEARLSAVLDGAQDGILSADENGEIQSINAAGAAMLGYERRELIGQNTHLLCVDCDGASCGPKRPLVQMGSADGHPRTLTCPRKDGSTFPAEVRTFRSHIGAAPLYVSFFRDLSERRVIEARMEQLKEQRLAAMGGMAAALAHELNQPLAAISLQVETAQRLSRLAPEDRPFSIEESLDAAVAQTLRAGEIISHLRQFAARGEPDKSIQSLHALLREVCAAAPVKGPGRIEMRFDAARDIVFVDKVQIKQVVFNLVRNAFEAMTHVLEPVLAIATRNGEDNSILVDFTDSGQGISETIKGKLFEPLTTTKPAGMGVGLSLSRAIAAIHSGGLSVSSKAARGATFTLMLPLQTID